MLKALWQSICRDIFFDEEDTFFPSAESCCMAMKSKNKFAFIGNGRYNEK